jgi:hypothetical protein
MRSVSSSGMQRSKGTDCRDRRADGGDLGSVREEFDAANGAPAPQKGVRQPHVGEQFERAGFHDDRSVPAEGLRAAIDHVKGHAAARELDRESQPGRSGSDDENAIL